MANLNPTQLRKSFRTCSRSFGVALVVAGVPWFTACGGAGWRPETPTPNVESARLSAESRAALEAMTHRDPGLELFASKAYGYAVFPTVGKGGAVVGGAFGRGEVYECGQRVGTSSVTQLTAGLQFGGQAYSQVIFFADEAALRRFQEGNFELGAQASAIAVTAGAGASAAYDDGIAVFVLPRGGFMYEATVAGQKFDYEPEG